MSLINSGFDGTVTERDFSRILRGAGVRDSVETAAAWNVTQGTGRQVSVAPGVAYAAGVVSDSALAILASLPTPTNGQWHLVVRRINWSTNSVTVATIPHTTTSTTIPTAPPAGFPVFNNNTGVLVDQHLAWAWVRSTDTTVAVFDLRSVQGVRGVDLPVANFAALPLVSNFVGRQIAVSDTGITHRWNGTVWVADSELLTGAAAVTLNGGFTSVNRRIFRQGSLVTVTFDVTKGTAYGTSELLGTVVQSRLRPPADALVAGLNTSNSALVTFSVDTLGVIRLFPLGNLAAGQGAGFTLTYQVA